MKAGEKFNINHEFLILLSVKTESSLINAKQKLIDSEINFIDFYEPDPICDKDTAPMGYTAIATEPIGENSSCRKILKKFQMWKEK